MPVGLTTIKSPKSEGLKSGELIYSQGRIDPFTNALADTKSWPFNDQDVNSPVGVLCSMKGIVASIFRANHPNGGYDCYVSLGYAVTGLKGNTRAAWVGYNPPGGLSLSLVLRTKQHGFLGEVMLDRQDVGCADRDRLVVSRKDIDPDLFPLTDYVMLWTGEASWFQC